MGLLRSRRAASRAARAASSTPAFTSLADELALVDALASYVRSDAERAAALARVVRLARRIANNAHLTDEEAVKEGGGRAFRALAAARAR